MDNIKIYTEKFKELPSAYQQYVIAIQKALLFTMEKENLEKEKESKKEATL